MNLKAKVTTAFVGLAVLATMPAMAAGIGHSFFMRGSVVGKDSGGTIVCVGKADGAAVGQVLEVYRNTANPGPQKGVVVPYRRDRVGHVRIDHVFDDHFAHVSIVDGRPATNDIVELRKH